ncbi:MAG TPA: hypothetical protein VHE55_16420 [Fimbriimonadaceae bacterium]|nr:hypothetical protein [Fimbriimonadaceae bacterium]
MDSPEQYAAYPRDYGPGSFDPGPRRVRIEAIADAWRLMAADWGTWVLASLIMFGIALLAGLPLFVYSILRRGLQPADPFVYPPEYYLVAALCACFSQFIVGIASDGFIYLALKRLRGGYAPLGEAFSYGGRLGTLVVVEAILCPLSILSLVGGIVARNMFPNQASFDSLLRMPIGQLAGSLVMAVVMTLVIFAPLLVMDVGLSPAEALKSSIQAASPKFFGIFGLFFLTSILAMAGILACCVGILFTYPFILVIKAVLYHDFFRRKAEPAPPAAYGMTPPIA